MSVYDLEVRVPGIENQLLHLRDLLESHMVISICWKV